MCAETAHEHGIPFIADVNDLWPEAMRMVVNVPVVSDIAFRPFARDAHRVYELLSGAGEPPTSTPRAPPPIVRNLMSA